MERFKIVPACYLVLVDDGKILMLRRYNTGYEDGNYGLVAGHLDGGETYREATAREAKEEAGIIVDPDKLTVGHVMHRSTGDINDERMDIFMVANEWAGEIKNTEPEKCDDLRWFAIDCLPENTIPCVREAIGNIQNKIFYSEFGF